MFWRQHSPRVRDLPHRAGFPPLRRGPRPKNPGPEPRRVRSEQDGELRARKIRLDVLASWKPHDLVFSQLLIWGCYSDVVAANEPRTISFNPNIKA